MIAVARLTFDLQATPALIEMSKGRDLRDKGERHGTRGTAQAKVLGILLFHFRPSTKREWRKVEAGSHTCL